MQRRGIGDSDGCGHAAASGLTNLEEQETDEMTRELVGDLCHDNYFTGSKVGRLGVQVETYKNLTRARKH